MSAALAFASVGEAMDMARAALGYLAAVDATQLAAETQAECLRQLERSDAIATAARASFLSSRSRWARGIRPTRITARGRG